jgi:hypothetical protein
MTWWLADAEERNRNNATFELPSEDSRYGLHPGDIVKLLFETDQRAAGRFHGATGERMWVVVERVDDDGMCHGSLNSKPSFMADLEIMQAIKFEPKHVIQITRVSCIECRLEAPRFSDDPPRELDDLERLLDAEGWVQVPHPQVPAVKMRLCPDCSPTAVAEGS